ncbi:S8 family peptidase [Massilia genomosp. 1]|nr:S8/S53 family peptidase [Massilia genomosp. 1]
MAMSLAYAQSPDTTRSSPFGAADSSAAAAGPSMMQARAALAPAAVGKTNARHLDSLLAQESNEFIVLFKEEAPARMAASVVGAQRLTLQQNAFNATRQSVRAGFAKGEVEFVREYTTMPMALVRTRSRATLVKLLNDPKVASVTENIRVKPALAQSLPAIGQTQVVTSAPLGDGTVVVVLDDNADYMAPELGGCAPGTERCKVTDAISMVGGAYQKNKDSHGTAVAGIVAAVAPGAMLALLDIATRNAKNEVEADVATIIAGIDWSIWAGTRMNVAAINLSYGSPPTGPCNIGPSDALHAAFSRAREAGIIPVVASGNDYDANRVGYVACAAKRAGAVVVSATYTESGPLSDGLCGSYSRVVNTPACFANGGRDVTIYAPGTSIYIGPGIGSPYVHSGTSYAAPHVAGAVAVLRGISRPGYDQTIAYLTDTGSTMYDARNGVTTPRLDLYTSARNLGAARAMAAAPAAAKLGATAK